MKTRYTASVVVRLSDASKVLCMFHPKYARWVFPGGHVEPGEAPHEAAIRELREEVGLSVSLIDWTDLPLMSRGANSRMPQPIAVVEEDPTGRADGTVRYVDFVYVADGDRNAEKTVRTSPWLAWLSPDDLNGLVTAYPTAELAAAVLASAGRGA